MEVTTFSEINGIKTTSHKISGTNYPALRSSRIKPSNAKALSGSWTHVRRAMANDKLYCDRVKAITEWFNVWDSSQRCKFFLTFLRRCTKTELAYVEGWFIQRSPILRQDFTTVLPRWISLYILSFLDPRSLCQAAQVNWHWHFLAEQDAIWSPKCIRLGWMLPVFPSTKEYGAWKYHYVKCVKSLDFDVSAYHVRSLARRRNIIQEDNIIMCNDIDNDEACYDGYDEEEVLGFSESDIVHEETPRPPWKISTKSPRILEKDYVGILSTTPRSETKNDGNNNDYNYRTSKHNRSKSVPTSLTKSLKSKSSPLLSARENTTGHNRSTSRQLSFKSRSFQESLEIPLSPTSLDDYTMDRRKLKSASGSLFQTRRSLESKSFYSATADEPIVRREFAYDHPAVLFISSQMPAKEMLLDCTRFGTIVIPYDYEGTTLDSLVLFLKLKLAGRHAKCIGFCVDGDKSRGTARIIEGATLSISSLKHQEMQNFWKEIATHIHESKHSRVDIFWPLASSENGVDILEDLSKSTGVLFSSPVGLSGSLTRMETEWFKDDGKLRTVQTYFNQERVMTWINCCDYLEEAMMLLRKRFRYHLCEVHNGLAKNIIGELAAKLLKVSDFVALKRLCSAISSVFNDDDLHVLPEREVNERLHSITQAILEKHDPNETRTKTPADLKVIEPIGTSRMEERTNCALIIYHTESDYHEKLRSFNNIYGRPVLSSIQAKRAIASSSSAKMIFSDCEVLQNISSGLVQALKKRIDSWNSEQCLGDVYLTFTSNLKAYSNFLKNYPAILKTIERCVEENPSFRAFLDRQSKSLESGYLSIHEFLILPTKMCQRRADLLSTLIKCTPSEHKDRQYIVKALKTLREIADNCRQAEERIEKEKQFEELKIRIKGCPVLSTEGRYLLKEMQLSELAARKEQFSDNQSLAYLHIQGVTLFLFNDILVCSKRFLRLQPFKRSLCEELRFDFAIDPRQIRVLDVPDSKHFSNAFTISFPEREWLLQARSKEEKLSYMSLLSETSSSALPESWELLKRK